MTLHPCKKINAPDAVCRDIGPRFNRCCRCGRFVGEKFTGYEHDRLSKRGRLWCDRCAVLPEGNKS